MKDKIISKRHEVTDLTFPTTLLKVYAQISNGILVQRLSGPLENPTACTS